jgi:hypothetical protein
MNDDTGLSAAFQSQPGCLPIEDLARDLEFPPESMQRRAAEAHVSECAHCRTELALLREFVTGTPRGEEKEAVEWIQARLTPPQGVRSRSRWWQSMWSPRYAGVLAVAAALIIAINIEWHKPATVPQEQGDVMRSAPLHAIAPVGGLAGAPQEFRWTPVPGAAGYSILVTEVDLTPVFQSRVTGTSIPLPDEVRKILVPGKTLQWTVAAEDAAGRELATTGVQKFFTKPLQTR